jgi:hypothetical protein
LLPGNKLHRQRRRAAMVWRWCPPGSELRLKNGVTLGAKFNGEFAHGSSTYAGTGMVRVAW